MRDGTYYWRSEDGSQYTKIPQFLFLTIQGQHTQTAVFGPYIFYNNFELTREAQYIKRMLAYPTLTARAKQKVDKILVGYRHWVTVDDEFMSILERRNSNDNGQRNTKQWKER